MRFAKFILSLLFVPVIFFTVSIFVGVVFYIYGGGNLFVDSDRWAALILATMISIVPAFVGWILLDEMN